MAGVFPGLQTYKEIVCYNRAFYAKQFIGLLNY